LNLQVWADRCTGARNKPEDIKARIICESRSQVHVSSLDNVALYDMDEQSRFKQMINHSPTRPASQIQKPFPPAAPITAAATIIPEITDAASTRKMDVDSALSLSKRAISKLALHNAQENVIATCDISKNPAEKLTHTNGPKNERNTRSSARRQSLAALPSSNQTNGPASARRSSLGGPSSNSDFKLLTKPPKFVQPKKATGLAALLKTGKSDPRNKANKATKHGLKVHPQTARPPRPVRSNESANLTMR
jgi:hypothetical protein